MMPVPQRVKELPIAELDPYTLQDIRAFKRVVDTTLLSAKECSPEVIDSVVNLTKWKKETISKIKELMRERKIDREVGRKVIRYINEEFDETINMVKAELFTCGLNG